MEILLIAMIVDLQILVWKSNVCAKLYDCSKSDIWCFKVLSQVITIKVPT